MKLIKISIPSYSAVFDIENDLMLWTDHTLFYIPSIKYIYTCIFDTTVLNIYTSSLFYEVCIIILSLKIYTHFKKKRSLAIVSQIFGNLL